MKYARVLLPLWLLFIVLIFAGLGIGWLLWILLYAL